MLGAPVAGNVGRALCELDGRIEPGELVVCEVSSFQLEDIHEFRPHVAVLLNLEPDHLDRHGSIEAYRAAKLRIFENQDEAATPRSSRSASTTFPAARSGSSSSRATRYPPSR